MSVTIVYAHPWNESFNHAVLTRTISLLEEKGENITLIDLYKDGFDPVMSEQDLALYSKGKSTDKLVERYNQILDQTSKIIFIFPIWWYDMPAILRGFFDKVMLKNSAYTSDNEGLHGLRKINETLILTTSSTSTDNLVNLFGDPVNGTIINGTFRAVGFYHAKWSNLGGADKITDAERKEYLDGLSQYFV